ncbi:general substrate transporter [Teratosphaeria destructans]|uniref:General substrate transporter n=1 Tax=Teratosphaeria destructans TaxID=418781 RepID=A0A9W7W2S5_9PEZI|nr:general substrate transporter [Teratosphaeria destructans]
MLGFTHRGLLGGRINGRALEIGVCATASSGFFLLGYDQGVMSGIITEPIFLDTFPQMNSKNKEGAIQALVVAIYEVGCLFGALAMVAYGDKIGRRRAVLLGASIMIIGAILQTSSYGLAQLIVGRIVTGIGNGMSTSNIPVWQSEMAPPKIRGFLVLFEGALITGGIVVSYWLNYGFWFVTSHGSLQWRFPIGFQMLFGLLLIFGVLLFPESPRWLLKHGKEEDAAEIMGWLHECSPEDPQVRSDIDEINELNAATQGQKLTWGEFFGNKDRNMNLWRASAACGSQAMQQISGINLVTYYATTVFEDSLGFDGTLSRFMTAWLGTEYFLSACLALFIVDRLGRRFLMMSCAAGMAGCLLIIGACLSYANKSNKGPAYAATVFIFVYDSFFAIGWLGVTWLYPAEVTPIRTRAEAAGFATATNWIFNYLVVQLAPIMINTISWKTYFVFFCFNIAFVPIVYFFLPETNGYKLETLDAIFAQAHDKGENPVFTEKRVRKDGGKLQAIEATLQDESKDKPDDTKNGVEGVEDRSRGSNNGRSHQFDEEKHIDEL